MWDLPPCPRGSRRQGDGEMAESLATTSFGESAHDAVRRNVLPRSEPLTPRACRPLAAAGRAFTVSLMLLASPVVGWTPARWHHAPLRSLALTGVRGHQRELDPVDQDRAASNGLVMLGQTARDAFCRTLCPWSKPRVDTPTWRFHIRIGASHTRSSRVPPVPRQGQPRLHHD